tara:strand:+ start:108 stop:443 length:336 start_codon:yes stop_codon:yes gene_type:complete
MKHLLFTLRYCPFNTLNDEGMIREHLKIASQQSLSTLLDITSHKFDPQGVTAVALLAESHISIHTWPEKGIAVCDIFTCSDLGAPKMAAEYLKTALKAGIMNSELIRRELD